MKLEGLKLIRLNSVGVDRLDDPSYPYKLEGNFCPPEFMQVAFVMRHGGSEELVVRAMSREILDQFLVETDIRCHPRLCRLVITGPDGIEEEIGQKQHSGRSMT